MDTPKLYVYITAGKIVMKSPRKYVVQNTTIIETEFKKTDQLIYEDGVVKIYKESQQWKKDNHIETLKEKNEKLEKENSQLQEISDREIRKEL